MTLCNIFTVLQRFQKERNRVLSHKSWHHLIFIFNKLWLKTVGTEKDIKGNYKRIPVAFSSPNTWFARALNSPWKSINPLKSPWKLKKLFKSLKSPWIFPSSPWILSKHPWKSKTSLTQCCLAHGKLWKLSKTQFSAQVFCSKFVWWFLVSFIAVIWRTLGTVPSRDKVLQYPSPPTISYRSRAQGIFLCYGVKRAERSLLIQ